MIADSPQHLNTVIETQCSRLYVPFDINSLVNQSWFYHLEMHDVLLRFGVGLLLMLEQRVPLSLIENFVGIDNVQILIESSDAALQTADNQGQEKDETGEDS